MNAKRMGKGLHAAVRQKTDESDLRDLLAYLKHRIHRPTHNVYVQYFKKLPGQDYNWWKENQLLI